MPNEPTRSASVLQSFPDYECWFNYVIVLTYTDITLLQLKALRQQPNTAVVDVRDEWEFDEFNIGGLNVPLPELRARKPALLPFDTLIVICTNGARSRVAAKDLLRQPEFGHKTIYHLHGGIIEAVD